MGVFSKIGGAISSVGSAIGIPGAGVVGGLVGAVDGGESAPRPNNSPGNVVVRCPNAPSAERLRAALGASSSTEIAELKRLWAATDNGGYTWEQAVADLDFYAAAIWGGRDCKVSTTAGKRQMEYVLAWLDRHPYGDSPITAPVVAGPTAWDFVRDAASRIGGAVVEEAAGIANDAARPIVQQRAQDKFMDSLPTLAVGGAIAILLWRAVGKR